MVSGHDVKKKNKTKKGAHEMSMCIKAHTPECKNERNDLQQKVGALARHRICIGKMM